MPSRVNDQDHPRKHCNRIRNNNRMGTCPVIDRPHYRYRPPHSTGYQNASTQQRDQERYKPPKPSTCRCDGTLHPKGRTHAQSKSIRSSTYNTNRRIVCLRNSIYKLKVRTQSSPPCHRWGGRTNRSKRNITRSNRTSRLRTQTYCFGLPLHTW